jgi:methylmalonyl-CoA epimerase
MLEKIDHIGIVVKNLDETVEILSKAFGFAVTESISAPDGEFKTALVSSGGVRLELIQPLEARGSIAKFLENKGGGIHHLSFKVDNIEDELHSLESKGIRLVNNKPAEVSGSLVAFVHPGSTQGVLVELIQRTVDEPLQSVWSL